ncbi:4-hydroxy-3-methylbut-2-enyl diphosphatereductase [Striga asiatica]|uniref:4-hydroxy-3-methylbut-2-enyl diphosphatereductase n=1 Tax=Striga asiatica TaxID=4170 RepID=A0A5A7PEM7_STRAF|nr:4-hydroxy-3-methylbut-2-enyl diphosphatereductase [Striga asiatica]
MALHCSSLSFSCVGPSNRLMGPSLFFRNCLIVKPSAFSSPSPSSFVRFRLQGIVTSTTSAAQVEVEYEVAEGCTITEFCDKIIDVFLNEKPKSKDWKRYLIFRDEWGKYRERFYSRCKVRADAESDSQLKQKLINLSVKVKKIDDEMGKHAELLKEIEDNPMDINAIVARRRVDFTEDFFRHLTLLSEIYDGLEDRDAIARLGARCLSAVSAFDNTLEIVGTLDTAQEKFDDILNSPSIDEACEKIKSLAKGKALDSSLILLINGAWASAKESTTMKNEVKDIMYRLYKATQSSLRSIAPKEIKLLKYLLNITDPEERFSALATAFSPGDERDTKQPNAIYTSPKELHKWIKIMLDAYHLSTEENEIREAKKMNQPVVIQRLFILKETIEAEYLEKNTNTETDVNSEES